ncbi:hypothetical protein BH11MYX4_BH11MYX4_06590 [soil metagenome]
MRRWPLFACCALAACITERDLGGHARGDGLTGPDGGALEGGASEGGVVPPRVDGGHDGKIFFVTKGLYTGDLAKQGGAASGLAGGDAICTAEAGAARLGGVFKAWLSTSAENAKDRIALVGPWHMTSGATVFAAGPITGPEDFPRYAADGEDLFFANDARAWTGTNRQNKVTDNGDTCASWASSRPSDKGSFGGITYIGGEWTDYRALDQTPETRACSERLRLYCFEQ